MMEDIQITQVALRGRLIDLKEAEEETVQEEWQTKSLEKQIQTAGLRKKGFMMPLAVDTEEVTSDLKSLELVHEFMPKITLSGWELRGERKSKAWGGTYFRVLEDTKEETKCIQWIFVWTKQRFFISLWMTVVPLFLLAVTGVLIYSYLNLQQAAISILLIGTIFFLLGSSQLYYAVKGMTKGAFYFNNRQLFIVYGGAFWLLLAEIYFTKGTRGIDIYKGAEIFHKIPFGQTIIDNISQATLGKTLIIPWVSIFFLILGIVALVLWKWEPPSFTHATHDMDWAPFFIYVKKEGKGEWKLDKVRYDAFHYFAETKTLDELVKEKSISKNLKHVHFEIPNFWHSFSPSGRYSHWFIVFIGVIITIIAVLIGFIYFNPNFENLVGVEIFRFVIFPVFLFLGAFLVFSKWPLNVMPKKMDVNDSIYHLTENRLRIFWNMKGEEPALKVRSKIQDPFMESEWFSTFRDDLEQIVYYNILPKLRSLEQKEFFQKL